MLKGPLDKYFIGNLYNLNKVGKEPKSKLEVIANSVKIIMKSTFNYLKKYGSATPEMGDHGSPYYKEKDKRWN